MPFSQAKPKSTTMRPDQPPIIATDEPTPSNRMPVVLQLGVLALILAGLFGAFLFGDTAVTEPVTNADTRVAQHDRPASSAGVPQPITAPVALTAEAAYVWDVRGQRALYEKNADAALPLASITKLMTALLAYELVATDTTVSVPLSAIRQAGNSGLVAGETLTAHALSELALIASSNDAAHSLAASVGSLLGDRDPTAQFVAGMNLRAEELGLPSLAFKNTTGLDLSPTEPGAVGSARDVSFLLEHLINNYPELVAPTREESALIYNTAGAYHEAANTNALVAEIPNLLASKTGYTDLAGGNLTIAFAAGLDRPIIITVLGSTRSDRFTDVATLIDAVQQTVTASAE